MSQHQDRVIDLLASRATEGLSRPEIEELEQLITQQDSIGIDDLDYAAASADLAFQAAAKDAEPMPDALKARVIADAAAAFRDTSASNISATPALDPATVPAATPTPFLVRNLGWLAAAAMLVLALWAPWRSTAPVPTPVPAPPPLAEQRAALIADAPDVIQVDWAPPEIERYADVRGDVVWSKEQQRGFMRLIGLPPNQSDQAQYQLWIVDPTRDKHPIDGGVFDITATASGEVIVPIDAKLTVDQAAAFAITLEKPGGVVVSAGPLLVIAAVS